MLTADTQIFFLCKKGRGRKESSLTLQSVSRLRECYFVANAKKFWSFSPVEATSPRPYPDHLVNAQNRISSVLELEP